MVGADALNALRKSQTFTGIHSPPAEGVKRSKLLFLMIWHPTFSQSTWSEIKSPTQEAGAEPRMAACRAASLVG
jgi:hypothetical protein